MTALADLLLIGGALAIWWNMSGAAPTAPGKVTMKLDPNEALAIINRVNAEMGGWHDPRDVLATIAVESSFNTNAYRAEPQLGDASYGLMQVLSRTARDMGYSGAADGLFDPETNIRVGMAYMRWTWEFLERKLGRTPSEAEWFSAYNGGVGNVAKGWTSLAYVTKIERARAGIAVG